MTPNSGSKFLRASTTELPRPLTARILAREFYLTKLVAAGRESIEIKPKVVHAYLVDHDAVFNDLCPSLEVVSRWIKDFDLEIC